MKTEIIAEIGLNYAYGTDNQKFLEQAIRLIDVAVVAGCDYVKFQKRDPDICVPEAEKNKAKRVPWRKEETTYLQYKKDIEFGEEEYNVISQYCKERNIKMFASIWDSKSAEFMLKYTDIAKIPSALITDLELLKTVRTLYKTVIISTGMSTEEEINEAISIGNPDIVMHTNSAYPSPVDELRLDYIKWIADNHPTVIPGYSGHEFGLTTTIASVLLGAKVIERHITLDRANWGSDQMSSVEPQGLIKLVKSIRDIEKSLGGYGPREVLGSELEKRKSLRGN